MPFSAYPLVSSRVPLRFFHLVVGLIAAAIPFVAVDYFPSTDGPIHATLTKLLLGDLSELQREFYEQNPFIEPNFAVYALGIAASFLTDHAGIEWSMALMVSVIYVVASFFIIRHARGHPVWFYLLVLSSSHYFLHMGFLNYSLSIAFFISAIALIPAIEGSKPVPKYLFYCGLLLILVLTHLVGFASFCLVLAGQATARALGASKQPAGERFRSWIVEGGLLLVSALPAFVLSFSFFARHGLSEQKADIVPFSEKLLHFASQAHLYSFHPAEAVGYAPILVLLGAVIFISILSVMTGHEQKSARDGALIAIVLLTLLYFFFPLTTKNVPIGERLLPFIFVLAVLYAAQRRLNKRLQRYVVVYCVLLVITLTGYKVWQYQRINTYLEDYHSVLTELPEGQIVLPLHFWDQAIPVKGQMFTWRTDPFRHSVLHSLSDKGSVSLRNALMSKEVFGYMPYVFRSDVDPYRFADYVYTNIPDTADFLSFEACTGRQIDYLVVFFEEDYRTIDADVVNAVHATFDQSFQLVATSPLGLSTVYKRIDDAAEADKPLRQAATC